MGNKLPTPTLSAVHNGHYITFFEVTNHIKHLKEQAQGPDVGCPSLSEVKLCPRSCMYVISSKTDGKDMNSWFITMRGRMSFKPREEREREMQMKPEVIMTGCANLDWWMECSVSLAVKPTMV
ncbi:uncharacterized protein [Ptychodera flava]|uniref:uncharacterized protein n=1 Tax=Ptychodera flava TaxID=63121 RepID=UPI003969DF2F